MTKRIQAAAFCAILNGQTAFAAEAPTDDTWGIALWVFVGYCTLIVVPQALKAFRFLITPRVGAATKPDTGTNEPRAARDTAL